MVISITHSGYVKRLPLATYRQQRRGGIGRDGDGPQGGRLHRAPAHLLDPRLPAVLHQPRQGLPAEGLRAARGLADLEGPGAGERAAAARRRAGDGGDPHPRLQGGQVPRLRHRQGPGEEDRVHRPTTRRSRPTGSSRSRSATATSWSQVRLTDGDDDILLVSKSGHASRFSREEGAVDGPRHLRRQGDERRRQDRHGSRTACWRWTSPATTRSSSSSPRTATASAPQVSEYPVKGRGTKGVLTIKLTAKKGGLAGALIVREHQDLLFISQNGMVQRTNAGGISQMGRATQGVRVMNMKDDDRVSRRRPRGRVRRRRRRRRGGGGGRRGGGRGREAGEGEAGEEELGTDLPVGPDRAKTGIGSLQRHGTPATKRG